MPYKTVLAHLTSEHNSGPIVECACAIGGLFGAHVVALYVFPAFRLTPPVPVPLSAEVAGTLRRKISDESARIKSIAQAQLASLSTPTLVPEWRAITTERRPVADIVVELARSADLVIAGQSDPDSELADLLDCADQIAIGAGRPVLVLPFGGRLRAPPRSVAIAWNGSRESARAAFDAVPLLKLAEAVEIVSISDEKVVPEGGMACADIAAALARHGVKPKISLHSPRSMNTADDLRDRVRSTGADLLVMGAYGHSRLSEFVFGGVTRKMLHDMPFPIFFSN